MIKNNQLKTYDYILYRQDNVITLRKQHRILEISQQGKHYVVNDSLLPQSNAYILDSEEELIKLIKELCKP